MGNLKKVVVAELNPYHDECLFSQCLMFKRLGMDVLVVANSRVANRVEKPLKSIGVRMKFMSFESGIDEIASIFSFHRMIRKMGDVHLHFNTAQGNVAWKLFLIPFPRRISITGVIHNVPKLKTSFGQKIISRQISRYMLLSDLLVPTYNKLCDKQYVVVYPVFYPQCETVELQKPEGEVWIVIPGAVSLGRRDFMSLFTEKSLRLNDKIKIILLGNINSGDGPEIANQIKENGMERNFITFNNYVPNDLFYSYIEKCDFFMPLVHPSKTHYAKYVNEKISGTYNLAIAYRKPMLCPTEMSEYEDFRDTSLFYNIDTIRAFLNSLVTEKRHKELFTLPKWTLEYQTKQLKTLISL